MSDKELRRSEVLGRVRRGEWKLSEAAMRLEISYRQAKRLWSRYRKGGAKALVHGNVGRRSNRAKPAEFRQRVGAGARVTVQQWRDQSLQVRFEEHEIEHEVIATPVPQPRVKPAAQRRPGGGRKPAANHPWRRVVLGKTRSANS